MAVMVPCVSCRKEIWVQAGQVAECDDCKRKRGVSVPKKWAEMTPEEKIEDLNNRLRCHSTVYDE